MFFRSMSTGLSTFLFIVIIGCQPNIKENQNNSLADDKPIQANEKVQFEYNFPVGRILGLNFNGSNYVLTGWSCIPNLSSGVAIHIYVGGGAGAGALQAITTTNQQSPQDINDTCGSAYQLHNFSYTLPMELLREKKYQKIHAYGIYNDKVAELVDSGRYQVPPPEIVLPPPAFPESGSIQGMVVDERMGAIVNPFAAVKWRRKGSNTWNFTSISPTFSLSLPAGIYELDFEYEGRTIYYSPCIKCTDHPTSSFIRKNSFLEMTVFNNTYTDLRFMAAVNSIVESTAAGVIQGMLVDGNGAALVLPGAGIKIKAWDSATWNYYPITPTFNVSLKPGIYNVELPAQEGRDIFVSPCASSECLNHPNSSYSRGNEITVFVTSGQFLDLRFKVVDISQNLPPANPTNTCPPGFNLRDNRCFPPAVDGNFKGRIGMFYSLWHCPFSETNTRGNPVRDITKIRAGSEQFGPVGTTHWWNEPADGYYCLTERSDILRKHAEQLRDAGIEFVYIDSTNHASSNGGFSADVEAQIKLPLLKLLEVWSTVPGAPRVVPWVPVSSQLTQGNVSNPILFPMLEWMLIQMANYPRMALMIEDAPFVLVGSNPDLLPIDNNLLAQLKEKYRFSHRLMWNQGWDLPNQWGHSVWCDGWENRSFFNSQAEGGVKCNQSFRGVNNEQLSVASAFNHYHFSLQETSVPRFHGRTFVRMLERVWDNPRVPFILIAGWNEWIASRNQNCTGELCGTGDGQINFVDLYSEERSRDFEPTKRTLPSGLPGNFYYQLLRSCISKMRQGVLCNVSDGFLTGGDVPRGLELACAENDCNSPGTPGSSPLKDFTGDGLSDFADLFLPSGDFWVHENVGGNSFRTGPNSDWAVGKLTVATGVRAVVGDFNCDGHSDVGDLIFAEHRLYVRENLMPERRGFRPPGSSLATGLIDTPFEGMDLLSEDFNGDGCDDILTKNHKSGKLRLHVNNWRNLSNINQLFANGIDVNFRAVNHPAWRLVVGDFNGDGLPDVADQNPLSGAMWVHFNLGIGVFSINDSWVIPGTLRPGPGSQWKILMGYFNNDARVDYAELLQVNPGSSLQGYFWIHSNLGQNCTQATASGCFTPAGSNNGGGQSVRPDANWMILGE